MMSSITNAASRQEHEHQHHQQQDLEHCDHHHHHHHHGSSTVSESVNGSTATDSESARCLHQEEHMQHQQVEASDRDDNNVREQLVTAVTIEVEGPPNSNTIVKHEEMASRSVAPHAQYSPVAVSTSAAAATQTSTQATPVVPAPGPTELDLLADFINDAVRKEQKEKSDAAIAAAAMNESATVVTTNAGGEPMSVVIDSANAGGPGGAQESGVVPMETNDNDVNNKDSGATDNSTTAVDAMDAVSAQQEQHDTVTATSTDVPTGETDGTMKEPADGKTDAVATLAIAASAAPMRNVAPQPDAPKANEADPTKTMQINSLQLVEAWEASKQAAALVTNVATTNNAVINAPATPNVSAAAVAATTLTTQDAGPPAKKAASKSKSAGAGSKNATYRSALAKRVMQPLIRNRQVLPRLEALKDPNKLYQLYKEKATEVDRLSNLIAEKDRSLLDLNDKLAFWKRRVLQLEMIKTPYKNRPHGPNGPHQALVPPGEGSNVEIEITPAATATAAAAASVAVAAPATPHMEIKMEVDASEKMEIDANAAAAVAGGEAMMIPAAGDAPPMESADAAAKLAAVAAAAGAVAHPAETIATAPMPTHEGIVKEECGNDVVVPAAAHVGEIVAVAASATVDGLEDDRKIIETEEGSVAIKLSGDFGRFGAKWKESFNKLVEYKLKYGHCEVPKSHQPQSLHWWVRQQRYNYKNLLSGKGDTCDMNQDRIDALNSIGFTWWMGRKTKDDQWEGNFQKLINFKSMSGTFRVTKEYDKKLHRWIEHQRARKKLLEKNGEGKCKGMTWARVEKLNSIGFTWSARDDPK